MKKVWGVILGIMFVHTMVSAAAPYRGSEDRWVDSIYQRMTYEERIGQLINLKISITRQNLSDYKALVKKYPIGSITITGGEPSAIMEFISVLKYETKCNPLIGFENTGRSLSIPANGVMKFPEKQILGHLNDASLFTALANAITGQYSVFKAKVVNIPVCKVDSNDGDLKFGFQDYGMDQHEGSEKMGNFTREINRAGCVTNIDWAMDIENTDEFAQNYKSLKWSETWLNAVSENAGFWKDFNNELSQITFTSVPEFTPKEAIFYRKRLFDPLLYKSLGFKGIVNGDIEAIHSTNPSGNIDDLIVRFLKAGGDMITTAVQPAILFEDIDKAVNSHYLRNSEIQLKVKRLLRLKYLTGCSVDSVVNTDNILRRVNNPDVNLVNYQIYGDAMALLRNDRGIIPYEQLDDTNFASLSIGSDHLNVYQETLEKYTSIVHYILPEGDYSTEELGSLLRQMSAFENVIVGLHMANNGEIDNRIINLLDSLRQHSNVVITVFGNNIPGKIGEDFPVILQAYEDNAYTQLLAPQVIFGAVQKSITSNKTQQNTFPHITAAYSVRPIRRLSYAPPELEGMDSRTLDRINDIVSESIDLKAMPGCQVLVARNGAVVFDKNYGYYTYDSIIPVTSRSIYDLASLTKVCATTQSIMYLLDHDQIDLNAKISDYLPELVGTNKQDLIVKDILLHQSGLKPFFPFWKNTIDVDISGNALNYYRDYPDPDYNSEVAYGMFASKELKDSLWTWTINTDLRRKSRYQKKYDYKYSDLGFYMLQMMVERITKRPLDVFVDSIFYKSIGMNTTTYNPLCKFPMNRIVPTEMDNDFRHVLVWGTVHDQIAAMYGGVAGHAGLFSNADDLAKLLQMNLQGGIYGTHRYLSTNVIDQFTARQNEDNRRGLGWDKPDLKDDLSPTSHYASPKTYGHQGFTGTAIWVDPTFNLIFVFLSNRVHPDASNFKLIEYNVRKRIQDLIYESIWSFEKVHN